MAIGLALLVGAAAGGATFLYAKKQRAQTGTAAVTGGVAGAGAAAATVAATAVVTAVWPLALLLGVPLALGYFIGKSQGQRALPPGR